MTNYCAWSEGYRAGLAGKVYADNPHEGEVSGTAWAFGCSEGMAERNRKSFTQIIEEMRSRESTA